MQTFNDTQGRAWQVDVTVETIKRVKGLLGLDLLEIVGGDLAERLSTDPILLCDVLYAVCKPEAEQRNVSDEEFGRGLAGDAIDAATGALLEALVDFFPKLRRGLLKTALGRLTELQTRAVELAEKRLKDPALEKRLEVILDESLEAPKSSGSASSSPESPE
jgi:hypothetical protein